MKYKDSIDIRMKLISKGQTKLHENAGVTDEAIAELAELASIQDEAFCEIAEVVSVQDEAIAELAGIIAEIMEG